VGLVVAKINSAPGTIEDNTLKSYSTQPTMQGFLNVKGGIIFRNEGVVDTGAMQHEKSVTRIEVQRFS